MNIIRPVLKEGDEIRVLAPSSSFAIINKEVREVARKRFGDLGLKITFGKNLEEIDGYDSSSIESRVADLHEAFANINVKAILTVIGGFNSNQLLPHLDWSLIKENPKPIIGYSDTTALQLAVYAKTGAVMYSGPAYSTFGQKLHFDYTLESFKKCLVSNEPFALTPSNIWSDDEWYIDQDNRDVNQNSGWQVVQEGEAEGVLLGGNLCTIELLFGTEYMPSLKSSILFLEEEGQDYKYFDRLLESLLQQPGFAEVKGILIGRFQKSSKMTAEKIKRLFAIRPHLAHLPVIANVDFGHVSPIITLPIGTGGRISASNGEVKIEVL